MALHLPLQFPITSPSHSQTQFKKPTLIFTTIPKTPHKFPKLTKHPLFAIKATSTEEQEEEPQPINEQPPAKADDVADVGAELRKVVEEREKKKEDFWGGVLEEVTEIEWPAFGKVVGTTGVVLGVIFGSSVVLLTLNALLAELSDRVFAGRGVQDFFG